jgi:dolichyl-phosphate beta-glucosyltransferase
MRPKLNYNRQLRSLSIVIPAYNEIRRLPLTLDRIAAWLDGKNLEFCEVLVVDDGSRDGTAEMVEEQAKKQSLLRLLRNPGNRGKGYAVRSGMLAAKGEWVLFTDADLSTPIEEVVKLQSRAVGSGAGIAIGSRALDPSTVEVHQSGFREWSGRFFNLVMRLVTGLPFRDTQCGFKLYQARAAREVFNRQRLDGFSFDVEDLFIARKLGILTIEVPVRWRNVEGTKVSAWNGLRSFWELVRIRSMSARGLYGKPVA